MEVRRVGDQLPTDFVSGFRPLYVAPQVAKPFVLILHLGKRAEYVVTIVLVPDPQVNRFTVQEALSPKIVGQIIGINRNVRFQTIWPIWAMSGVDELEFRTETRALMALICNGRELTQAS
jgi:hypothetical protein